MKLITLTIFVLFICVSTKAQKTLDVLLSASNNESVPYITAEELSEIQDTDSVLILDAREQEEFDVSHIASARFVGYNSFSSEKFIAEISNKNIPIIVYCSLGIRSEDIGEKLLNEGFTNVKNLYGGIFEWKNKGYPVIDSKGNETENVHAFSRFWGRWLKKGIKIY
jgi:rhodanese-related sulfurtransferase